LKALGFSEDKKKPDKLWLFLFFFVGKAWLWQSMAWVAYLLQTSSDESLWLHKVQRILQRLYCCLKNPRCIFKKQIYVSVITGKENASEIWRLDF